MNLSSQPTNGISSAIPPRFEAVLAALVERFRSGALSNELRPATLETLGGDFAAFYHAGFHRLERPAWAWEHFPDGFPSLVGVINARLGGSVVVRDTRRVSNLYRKLPQDSLKVIETLREQLAIGEITRKEALETLTANFRIELTPNQATYYFGATEPLAKRTTQESE